jgi:hypothetical protein
VVWAALGDVDNFIEPFFNSGAVLLARPRVQGVETVNDLDCMIANFWRATQHDPEAVAGHADGPVNEADLHSRHRWLVLSDDAAAFRAKMRTDPHHYDAKVAGWWVWGACCWIGGGWCSTPERIRRCQGQPPSDPSGLRGVHAGAANSEGLRRVEAPDGGTGTGVHEDIADGRLCDGGQDGHGVTAGPKHDTPTQQVPRLGARFGQPDLPGVLNPKGPTLPQGRPQLADAYDVGRGVHASPPAGLSQRVPRLSVAWEEGTSGQGIHANPSAGTCDARRAWLVGWFRRLRDRLRLVRVCCGDWSRVCSSDSTTTRLGVTGVFLDPPYPRYHKGKKSRAAGR